MPEKRHLYMYMHVSYILWLGQKSDYKTQLHAEFIIRKVCKCFQLHIPRFNRTISFSILHNSGKLSFKKIIESQKSWLKFERKFEIVENRKY